MQVENITRGTFPRVPVSKPGMPCGCCFAAFLGLFAVDPTPKTLRVAIDEWENKSWGLHDVDRRTQNCVLSVSSDGSRRNECRGTTYRYWVIPQFSGAVETLFIAPDRLVYRLDHERKTAHGGRDTCWDPSQLAWKDDARCTMMASMKLPGSRFTGTDRIAGVDVVRYHSNGLGLNESEMALAPSLSCEIFEHTTTWRGNLHLPSSVYRYRVTGYKPGEPDPSLFRIPPGYTIMK